MKHLYKTSVHIDNKNIMKKGNIGIRTNTPEYFITISYTKAEYKKQYTLRTRIGLRLLWLVGVVGFDWKTNPKTIIR